jgi:hypothetical protein
MTRILIEIHEGHIVRNLLENDLLALLTADGAEVLLVTSGARVRAFVERYCRPGVTVRDLNLIAQTSLTRLEDYELALGNALTSRGLMAARRTLWRWVGEPAAERTNPATAALIDEWRPDVVVSTHLSQNYGRGLIAAARRRGIPTVGNVNSWDNVWKGLKIRPDIVTCWSSNNRDEVCKLAAYRPDEVEIIGAPAFDPYFADDANWTRDELCARLGLDPARPFLLFATLGQFTQQIDETNMAEVLLRALDDGRLNAKSGTPKPQIVLRMHPWSREAYFRPLLQHPDVFMSRYEGYFPGLGWSPTRDETILAGNLMRHAGAVISPGSTMCIEAAIFDTPTIVPVFNEYMPEVFETYFRQTWLNQHFGRLYQRDWVPVLRDADGLIDAVNRALAEPDWYQNGRAQIRAELLGPLDGKATERFATIILKHAGMG